VAEKAERESPTQTIIMDAQLKLASAILASNGAWSDGLALS